jgi:hypothetical protein
MWLTDEQLIELTRRKQPRAQIRILNEAGIPYRIVAGRPVVLRSDLTEHEEPRSKVKLRLAS